MYPLENGRQRLNRFLEHLTFPPLEPGRILSERYRIERLIDSGGMADVYEATDIETDARYAIKVLRLDLSVSPERVEQFKRELIANQAVNHPAINPTYEICQEKTEARRPLWFLKMRYAPGRNLEQRIRPESETSESSITVRTFVSWFTTLADGLGAIHAAGVIHGDLTPRNVQIVIRDGSEFPLIMDFGLARLRNEKADSSKAGIGGAGSLGYMSPEQEQRQPLTTASDVFSLGRVMDSVFSRVRARAAGRPLLYLLRRVINKCLRQEPNKRYPNGFALSRAVTLAAWAGRGTQGALVAAFAGCVVFACLQLPPVQQRLNPQPPPNALYYYESGSAHLLAGADYAAVRSFRKALELHPDWPLALAGQAEALDGIDAHRQAVGQMSRALTPGWHATRSERRYIEALRAYFAQNWPAAESSLKELMREPGGSLGLRSRALLGKVYERSGAQDEALQLYRSPVNVSAQGGQLLRLAAILTDRMQFEEARFSCHKAQESFDAASDSEGLIESVYREGYLENHYGDAVKAKELLARALKLATSAENNQQTARIYVELAMFNVWGGDLDQARRYDDLARDMIVRYGMDTLAPSELKAQGDIYLHKNDTASAKSAYSAGLALARGLDARGSQATLLVSLADVCIFTAAIQEGAQYAKEAIKLARANRYPRLISLALLFQGRAKRKLGEYDEAIRAFREELNIAETAHDSAGIAQANEGIDSVLVEEQLYPQALRSVRKTIDLANADGQKVMAGYSAVRGALLARELGETAAAREFIGKALPLSAAIPALRTRCNFATGMISALTANPVQAIELLILAEQEYAPEDRESRAEAESMIGTQEVLLGRDGPGLRRARDAFITAQSLNIATLQAKTEVNLAWIYLKTRHPDQAIALLAGSGHRKGVFPETEWRVHRILASAYRSKKMNAEASQEDEQARRSLSKLKQCWEGMNWGSYCRRPDLQRDYGLARELAVAQ